MHPESFALMAEMLNRPSQEQGQSVLDVGSLDVNGTFAPIVTGRGWTYTGLDLRPGKNVDVLATSHNEFPFEDGAFDIVISGSTMEHVTHPWLWIVEVVRVLKPGGFLAIHTHWSFPEHRFPIDTYRYLPDGMHVMFDLTGCLEKRKIRIANQWDIVASAFKCA